MSITILFSGVARTVSDMLSSITMATESPAQREKQKAEWKDKFDNWKEEVGDKVTNLKNDIKARFEKK